jgi:hypothetical protein
VWEGLFILFIVRTGVGVPVNLKYSEVQYSACTGRRAMYSLILFLFGDMEKRMCYWWKYSECMGRRAMYSWILLFFLL